MENEPMRESSALTLFLAAFDGVPQRGSRELRLSEEELEELCALFPQAVFTPMEENGVRRWYRVTFS
jgi:hypothetical protein